jgi:Putative sensor
MRRSLSSALPQTALPQTVLPRPAAIRGAAVLPATRRAAAGQLRQATLGAGGRLPISGNPLRFAVSASPWRAAWYLIGYLVMGSVLATIAFSAATTAASLAVTLIGIPLMPAAARVLRWCADAERRRLRQVLTEPVRGEYPPVTGAGVLERAVAPWRQRVTWRDFGYLAGMWVPLSVLDTVVLAVWAWFLGMITLPVWYWAPWMQYHGRRLHGYQLGFWFPHGPAGPGTVGVFIDSLPKALAAAAVGLAGFLLLNYAVVATARAQARVARALLRPPADPLAPVRDVLTQPGPLGPLTGQAPESGQASESGQAPESGQASES